jgi:hypothetical protein
MTQPIVSEDPDGLDCYSDHAHDISTVGQCMICTSTDPRVVGHVLPDVERYTDIDPVKAASIVVFTKSAKLVDGVLLDHYSASAILAVYNALSSPDAKDKLRAMTLPKAADVCFKVINKANERG